MANAYRRSLQVIKRDPHSASAKVLAKLVLSLYHHVCLPGLRAELGQIDELAQHLAALLVVDYLLNGESSELIAAGMTLTAAYGREQLQPIQISRVQFCGNTACY